MKAKSILFSLAATCCIVTNAQTLETDSYEIEMGYMTPECTYSFYYDDNGNEVYHGPFTHDYFSYGREVGIVLTLTYELKGTYKHGYLHGPVIMKSSNDFDESYASMSASFNEGLPNGNWKFNAAATNGSTKINANFKDGYLVGTLSINGLYPTVEYDEFINIAGSFNEDGEMTGKWTFGNSYNTYLNGVILDSEEYDETLKKLAKEYAEGIISEDDLRNKYKIKVYPCETEIYESLFTILEECPLMAWSDLENIQSVYSSDVSFQYLDYIPQLTEEGVDYIINHFTEKGTFINEEFYIYGYTKGADIEYLGSTNDIHISNTHNSIEGNDADGVLIKVSDSMYNLLKENNLSKSLPTYSSEIYITLDEYDRLMESFRPILDNDVSNQYLNDLKKDISRNGALSLPEGIDNDVTIHYYPIVAIEHLGSGREVIGSEEYLAIKLKVNRVYIKGTGYKTYEWTHYLNVDNYSLCQEETYNPDRLVHIVNDYDRINELIGIINANSKTINEIAVRAHANVAESYNEQIAYMVEIDHEDLKGTIERLESAVEIQKGCVPWMKKCVEIKAADDALAQEIKLYQDIYDVYNNYMVANKIEWNGRNDMQSLDIILQTQNAAKTYIDTRKTLDSNHEFITNAMIDFASINKGYPEYLHSVNTACPADFNTNVLNEVIAVQGNAIKFMEYSNQIGKSHVTISNEAALYKDIAKAYAAYYKTINMTWTLNYDLAILENVINIQNNTIKFLEKKGQIITNTTSIQGQTAETNDVFKAYTSYIKGTDQTWSPDVNLAKLDSIIDIQTRTTQFVEKRDLISASTAEITTLADLHKDLVKDYGTFFKAADVSWTVEVNQAKLDSLIDIQNRTRQFIEKRDLIEANYTRILTEGETHKDITKEYTTLFKTLDLAWTPDVNQEKLEEVIALQELTLEFIALRNQIVDNNVELEELGDSGKAIYKVYNTFIKDADVAWTPEVDKEKLLSLIKLQEDCKTLFNKPSIKDINDVVRKEKITDINLIIDSFINE